ncbi:type II secretion system F family protein [Hyphomicrobium facile]|uniref:General secretion pathway protein F n=1 Tax=Hyphomicrobium facile TaxID=51670 RepID=A0A1I7NFX4_9HYPH|nr:type II secretion system F family protein [Hyphomicrobium facile]SFV33456.1 general secretion pathway protein F [Hyphomicrobium facile]
MARYSYTAISRSGSQLAGEMEAAARENVIDALVKLGHLPVEVHERSQTSGTAAGGKGGLFSRPPSSKQITLFTRELGILLAAGLPIDQSLALLEQDSVSAKMRQLLGAIAAQIRDGKSLHEALASQPAAFPPVYVNMVRVAETSGTLEAVLLRIAQSREKTEKLASKALSQMLYPCLLILMAIAAVTIMLTFVVPRFKDMIMQQGNEVPEQARLVIGASDWLIANGQFILIALAAFIRLISVGWTRGWGREAIENAILRLPLIGHVARLNLTVRFCRVLGALLENGVELHSAIKLVRDVIGNQLVGRVLDESYDALRKGRSFLEPLANSKLFPAVVISMLRVGEETGNLTNACSHMADMFEDKMETAIQRTFTIVEPAVILLVSAFIGGIVVSIFGAIISMNDLAM